MKKIFFILCLLTTVIASARTTSYEITAEQYRRDDLVTEKVKLSLAEIAAAAGFSSSAAMQEAMQSENIFWGSDSIGGGELTNDYTHTESKGFYLDANGYVAPLRDERTRKILSYFFCYLRADTAKDEFVVHIGQVPEKCKEGDVFRTAVYLINKADTVKFDIQFSIKQDIGIPNPTLDLSVLDIIGETEIHIDASSYFPGSISLKINDIAEKLGVEDMSYPQMADRMLYAKTYDIMTEKITDNLVGYADNHKLDFKLDDFNEKPVCPCAALTSIYKTYSDCFTIKGLNYEQESGMLTASVIANEEYSKAGDKFETQLYLIYANRAFKINLLVSIVKSELKRMENLEYVGKSTLKLEITTENSSKTFGFDINLIKEKLNCYDMEAINLLVLDDNGFVNGKFNFMEIGRSYEITTRGTWCNKKFKNEEDYGFYISIYPGLIFDSFFSIFKLSPSHISINPKTVEAGDTVVYKTPLLFVCCNRVYEVELITTFKSHYASFDGGEEVGSESIYVQLPKSKNSVRSADLYADYSKAVELTGSNSLQAFVYKNHEEAQKKGMMANQPYFCMTSEGDKILQDSISFYRANEKEYLNITPYIRYFNEEDFSRNYFGFYLYNSVNTIYTGSVFLVNTENKKYYTVNYVLEPVDEVRYMDYVGEEEILLPISNNSSSHTEFDISRGAEALGIQGEQLPVETQWRANRSNKATMLYTDAGYSDIHGGFAFDAEGCVTEKENKTAFYAGYAHEDGRHCFQTSSVVPLEDGQEYATRLALDYGDKRYVFRIRLVNEKTYTAIAGTEAEKPRNNGIIYDLGGRAVGREGNSTEGLAKGIYICNGRKFIIR
ncbi:MAG: DUF4859 domain-containing protein [Bacteroidaceae bacterium]|nr:DUF4859 domain-containing protein [Bacteroidaceae bacterium]